VTSVGGIFPPFESDWFRKATAALCYSEHGGSGYGFTRADVLAMDLDDVEFFLEWLEDRRRAEATAIRKASRGRG
jgi:hypothetical protein